MTNDKYEITSISHPEYPWLHRIRALRDVGVDVKKDDLGGYVESDSNLSYEPDDKAWLYDDSISCCEAFVCQDSTLRENALARDQAYIAKGSCMDGYTVVEDDAMIQGASLSGNARISGTGMALSDRGGRCPMVTGDASVYGIVCGNFHLDGQTVILEGEKLYNQRDDRIVISNGLRYVERKMDRNYPQPSPSRKAAPNEKKTTKAREQIR